MTRNDGPDGPRPLFSGGDDRSIDDRTPEPGSCEYETPAGPCGDKGRTVSLAGVRVSLCANHLEVTLEQNGFTRNVLKRRATGLAWGTPA